MHFRNPKIQLAKWIVSLLLLHLGSLLYAQPELNEKIPVDPAIRIGKLSTGSSHNKHCIVQIFTGNA